MKFAWDDKKGRSNLKKHGVSFEEAKELFRDGNDFLQIFDEKNSVYEDRFISIGPISRGIIIVIVTEPDEYTIRIISARMATKKEVLLFNNYLKGNK